MNTNVENYLADLGRELVILALQAQQSSSEAGNAFENGRQLAFYEVLTLMRSQARAFGISDTMLGIAGVDIEQLAGPSKRN